MSPPKSSIRIMRPIAIFILLIVFCRFYLQAAAEIGPIVDHDAGGGPPVELKANDISQEERTQANAIIAAHRAVANGSQAGGPAQYPFIPVAGNVWQDRFVNNFVDLDPTSPGILDWDCTDFTYDGHTGHDIDLRSFGEQDVGVPVFAALDGVVSAVHDGEYDRNTSMNNQPANYVIISHGGTHYSSYWHLRKNSVAVSVGQTVFAGQQIGLAGSSGSSTGPHLHFESQYNSAVYEPSAG